MLFESGSGNFFILILPEGVLVDDPWVTSVVKERGCDPWLEAGHMNSSAYVGLNIRKIYLKDKPAANIYTANLLDTIWKTQGEAIDRGKE